MAGKSSYSSEPGYGRFFSGVGERENPTISDSPAFEFDEADIWNSHLSQSETRSEFKKRIPSSRGSKKSTKKTEGGSDRGAASWASPSLPVNIPDWSRILRLEGGRRREPEEEFDEEEEDGDRIPPHEYLAKQVERTRIASFSVHEGAGRTLKGRDLSRVRNAVWEKTGFLKD